MVSYPHAGTSTLSKPTSKHEQPWSPGPWLHPPERSPPIALHSRLVSLSPRGCSSATIRPTPPSTSTCNSGEHCWPMINTTKNPPPTEHGLTPQQAPAPQRTSITQRPRLARLGKPRDAGGPAPKRLTWPDHGVRNRRSRHFTQDADHWGQSPIASGPRPRTAPAPYFAAGILAARDPSAGIELPILAAAWSDRKSRARSKAAPWKEPWISLPRVISLLLA